MIFFSPFLTIENLQKHLFLIFIFKYNFLAIHILPVKKKAGAERLNPVVLTSPILLGMEVLQVLTM
jgi:hypothetical protein